MMNRKHKTKIWKWKRHQRRAQWRELKARRRHVCCKMPCPSKAKNLEELPYPAVVRSSANKKKTTPKPFYNSISIEGADGFKQTYTHVQLLEYESFFGRSSRNIDTTAILSTLSREQVIRFVGTLLNIYKNVGLDKLNLLIASAHRKNWMIICDRLLRLRSKSPHTPFAICSSKTAFDILRLAFSIDPSKTGHLQDNEETEMNLFKVMLAINQKLASYKLKDKKSLPKLMFINAHVNSLMESEDDHDFRNRYIFQMSMAHKFFSYFSTEQKYQRLYQAFLEKYNVDSWQEYLKTICALFLIQAQSKQAKFLDKDLSLDVDHVINKEVLNRITISHDAVIPYSANKSAVRTANDDYRAFREKPIIVMPNGDYFIYCWEFIADKMYNSLYFELKGLKAGKVNVDDLFTKVFCEGDVFNNLLARCYDPKSVTGVTEDTCKARYVKKDGELGPPDYILKHNNNVILFECKDVRMPGNVLETNNYEEIIEIYSNKLYKKRYQGTDDNKKMLAENDYDRIGITQLTGHLEGIRKGNFHWDDCDADSNIYPVLVLSDYKYIKHGLPGIMEEWYRESIKELGVEHEGNRPLVVMSFLTLFKYAELFKTDGFCKYFDEYHRVNASGIITFDDYMSRYKYNLGELGERTIREVMNRNN